jgi:class 3 adenylate cyclase
MRYTGRFAGLAMALAAFLGAQITSVALPVVEINNLTGDPAHFAARIGAEASAEEILVSTETLAGLGDLDIPVSEPRSVQLKGVPDPVTVSAVEWR